MMELPSTGLNWSLQFRIAYIVLVLAFQFHRKVLQSISVQNWYENAIVMKMLSQDLWRLLQKNIPLH